MPKYQPGIPTGTVNLDVDYQNIQNNFSQLNIAYGVDHIPFSDTSGIPPTPNGKSGMHTNVHLVPANLPMYSPLVGQLCSNTINDGVNTDQALFWLTGNNRTLQLTNNFVPVASSNGYTFLPGGLILQWGTFNPNSSTSVTFASNGNIAFPNAAFNIQFTGAASNNSTFRSGLSTGTLSKTGFTWQGTVDSHWNPIYYMVIGN